MADSQDTSIREVIELALEELDQRVGITGLGTVLGVLVGMALAGLV